MILPQLFFFLRHSTLYSFYMLFCLQFTKMHALTFREIFQTTIDHMVESIYRNYALQIIANSFLANVATSATFATILVEYLLERMEEMGSESAYFANSGLFLCSCVLVVVALIGVFHVSVTSDCLGHRMLLVLQYYTVRFIP